MINAADLVKAHEEFFAEKPAKDDDVGNTVVTPSKASPYPLQTDDAQYPLKGKL